MSLEIDQRDREGVTVLDLKGRLTMGEEVGAFRSAATKIAQSPNPNMILNLARVDYIDSTGLGALVMCSTTAKKAGGKIKLLNLNKRNIELLVMTKLATIFEIFSDEQDAVNSFFPDRQLKQFDILSFVNEMKEE
ncbi:MAG: STAS domain-containing protein [Acidobacteriota bacterium]|nr:STAS domain-containing protein [Acidobacteriota bacterium]